MRSASGPGAEVGGAGAELRTDWRVAGVLLRRNGGDALRRRVQDHAEGPEVGRGAGSLAQHPLWGDVFGRSDEAAGVRQVGLALDLRDAEVGEDDPVVAAQQDVVRLHVTMQDARCVGRFEGAEHLEADAGRVPRVEGALLQRVAQRAAGHQLHHDPRLTVDDGHIVHVHDGRVVEPGRRAGLAAHPLEGLLPFAFGKVVRDARFLHGDLAVHRLVLGTPHRAHTAVPELAEQPVPVSYEASGAEVTRCGGRVPGPAPNSASHRGCSGAARPRARWQA